MNSTAEIHALALLGDVQGAERQNMHTQADEHTCAYRYSQPTGLARPSDQIRPAARLSSSSPNLCIALPPDRGAPRQTVEHLFGLRKRNAGKICRGFEFVIRTRVLRLVV